MLREGDLEKALGDILPKQWSGNVHRAVSGVYIDSLASTLGSLKADGRFTKKDTFRALYTSHYKELAIKELTGNGLVKEAFPGAFSGNEICFSVEINAKRILDLSDMENLEKLGTSLQEITGDWKHYSEVMKLESPTQILGRVAYYSELFDAIRYLSRHDLSRTNLIIFPDRIGRPLVAKDLPEKYPAQIEIS